MISISIPIPIPLPIPIKSITQISRTKHLVIGSSNDQSNHIESDRMNVALAYFNE